MFHESSPNAIAAPEDTVLQTPEQRRRAVSIVAIGCGRSAAARALGFSPLAFDALVASDAALARELAQAEAAAEIAHMKTLHEAAKDPKNFRANMWWLERMRPEVYHRPAPRAVTDADLAAWTDRIVELIAAELDDENARARVLAQLEQLENIATT